MKKKEPEIILNQKIKSRNKKIKERIRLFS